METKIIRPATDLDAQVIADIYNYYIAHTVVTFEEQPVSWRDILDRMAKVADSNLP